MGQSLFQIYVHRIFTAKGREPLLVGALGAKHMPIFHEGIDGFWNTATLKTTNATGGTEGVCLGSPLQGSRSSRAWLITLAVAQGLC